MRDSQIDSIGTQALELAKRLNYVPGQVIALQVLAQTKFGSQPKVAEQLLAQASILAESTGDKALVIEVLFSTGLLHMYAFSNEGHQERALQYYQRAYSVAKSLGQPSLLALSMMYVGSYYHLQFKYEQALYWYYQWQNVAEKAGLSESAYTVLKLIGDIYLLLTDYHQALAFYQKALTRDDLAKQDMEIFIALGDCYRLTSRYPQAIAAYQRGLNVKTSLYLSQVNFYKSSLEAGLADTYQRQGNPLVLPYARQALLEANKRRLNEVSGRIATTLGRYYLQVGLADSAIHYGRQGFQAARQDVFKPELRDASQVLADAYAKQKNFTNAYTYLSRYLSLKDSISNVDASRRATAASFTDQVSRQQSQIALLTKTRQLEAQAARQQQILLNFLLGALLMLGILAYVLLRNNRQKQKDNALLNQQKGQIEQTLTELKTTQTQLIQKEKMASLGELTAGIAHEIQNPLNFVNNFSEVSTELIDELVGELDKNDPDEARAIAGDLAQNLQKITLHGQRASSIVRGMLEHSRASTGEKVPTDLNALADEYLRLAYHGLRAKDKNFNAELKTDFDPNLGTVNIVPQEMGRVLLNLFNNAFYAVSEKKKQPLDNYQPTVGVRTRRRNGKIVICVSDNGTGMPEAVKAKMFQPFFTTKPTGQGTGLGLSLSYDIVTKGHGGTLDVVTTEGQGTEFIITLSHS